MLVADLAHALPVAVLRHEAAARVLHRLEDHGRHRLRALELDHLLDRVRGPERVAVLGPAVRVRVRHVVGARHERLERRAQRRDAGDRERAEGGAVVGGLARDDLRLQRVAVQLVVLAGELPGRLDGLGAARGEEDPVEVAGREAGDALGQLDRLRVRVAPVGVEAELLDLRGRGLADLGAAVAGVHAEERREAVEVALAVLVVDVGALAARDDRDLVAVVVRAHAREVHPEMAARLLLKIAGSAGALARRRSAGWSPRLTLLGRFVGLAAVDNGIGAFGNRQESGS